MKLLFTISAVIVLRSSAQGLIPPCPGATAGELAPADALCHHKVGDGAGCEGGWLIKGETEDKDVWVDGNGCNPLAKEVFCHNAPSSFHPVEGEEQQCTGKCVVYAADGSHCKEDDIPDGPDGTSHGVLSEGGFHPYPLCGSLDNDRTWGGYDENGHRFDRDEHPIQVVANEIDSNSPGYANNNTKDKPKWLNNTNFVPGWYWCQAKEECMHPQFAWTTDGRQVDMDALDNAPTRHAQKCEGGETGGNWKDHIFEAPDVSVFETGCQHPDENTVEYRATFNEVPNTYEHCKVYQLPVGNSYSGKSKTQCASGQVDRCSGAVAFYFSIAGFGHNYNFNFCLSTSGRDGERTNAWNNGLLRR